MSKVLGPIHHWLYAKIGHQEALTAALAAQAREAGRIPDDAPFCRELPPLESVIDEGNIHGWLQERITDAERRFAALILAAGQDAAGLDFLCERAFAFGSAHALPAGIAPADAYRAFEDFFVNGMPCDRVNAVTESAADRISWEQTRELHAGLWTAQGGDAAVYYRLRRAVMDGMLAGSGLSLSTPDKDHYTICAR